MVSILMAIATYNALGALGPWSPTFAPQNLQVGDGEGGCRCPGGHVTCRLHAFVALGAAPLKLCWAYVLAPPAHLPPRPGTLFNPRLPATCNLQDR